MPELSSSRGSVLELAAIVAACLLAAILMHQAKSASDLALEDLALGAQTTSYFAKIDAAPIHCRDMRDSGCS